MEHYFTNNLDLKSNIKEFNVKINDFDFKFKTDNGVFSKGELDFGTYLLISNIIKENISGNILDLGCGYGAIGIILNKILNVDVDMIDINKRAIHLTKLNISQNKCNNTNAFVSDGYNLVLNKYDYIVSNPPIRVGKDKLYSLIKESKDHLKLNGKIYLVIRKEQGANSFINDFNDIYNIEVIDKKKGFYIICLKS